MQIYDAETAGTVEMCSQLTHSVWPV